MKLHIVARGRIGRGAEAELVERYAKRIGWPFAVTELPETGGRVAPLPPGGRVIALDETGEVLSSVELAQVLQAWRDAGVRECRFLIGTADGLSDAELSGADKRLSFGRLTWPHLLVRAMLAEQLYRATSIIAGASLSSRGVEFALCS